MVLRKVAQWSATLTGCLFLVACDGGGSFPDGAAPLGDVPELSASKREESRQEAGPPAPVKNPWVHILPVDHGVRADAGGNGNFLAPRGHGKHNGVDLLAPVGTPLLAACNGEATSGLSSSFGRWVQVVCPVPEEFSKGTPLFASLFYAHLDEAEVPRKEWVAIKRGATVGTVGKSGNARGSEIQPHVHFEVILHGSRRDAKEERHFGRNQRNTEAADTFARELDRVCVAPNKLRSDYGDWRRTRRLDPFVALACLSNRKPKLEPPPSPLQEYARSWSSHYRASGFDVNVGRRTN